MSMFFMVEDRYRSGTGVAGLASSWPGYSWLMPLLVLAVLFLGAGLPVQAQPWSSPGLDERVPISNDPLVYPSSRVRPPRSTGPVGVRFGLRIAGPGVCGLFDPPDYGRAGLRLPTAVAPGVVGGRDPLTCSLPALDGEPLFSPGRPGPAAGRLVPLAEAHNRGLCRQSAAVRALFAYDQGNLLPVLVPDGVLAERVRSDRSYPWLPPVNACWYVWMRIRVHQRWGLSMPPAEAELYTRVVGACRRDVLETPTCPVSIPDGGW